MLTLRRIAPACACNALAALALVAAAVPPLGAAGGVWKCAGGGGVPVYQDRPCDPGRALRDLAAEPPPLSVVPLARPPPAPVARPRRSERPPPASRRTEARKPVATGDAAERAHLREGMSEGEVLARIGPPDLASGKGARKLRWTYLPAGGDPQTMTLVRFEEGRVVAVERMIVR